jgi:hypothetical protein
MRACAWEQGCAAAQNSIAKARGWDENRPVPATHPITPAKGPAMFESFKHLFAHDSGPDSATPAPFDEDDIVLLDAEELAEGGILEAYEQLHPQLRQYASEEVDIAEEIDADGAAYTVFADERRYDIHGEGIEEDPWILATIAFFEIVNAGLAHATHRFYALYAGNDLAGVFLTDQQFQAAWQSIARPFERPWIPVNRAPDYGFPADEEPAA